MTSLGIASRKRTLHCRRCDYEWKTGRDKDPSMCPNCHNRSWNKPRPGEEGPRLEKPEVVVERLLQAASDILKTNSKCSIGKDLDGHYQAIPPLTLQRWRATPERYGRVMCHLDRETTADELGQALYGTVWKRSAA